MTARLPTQPLSEIRRAQLTTELLHIAATRGLDRVSVRTVAAAAGVSIGTVQHHFSTKDDMLVAAFRQVVATTAARLQAQPRANSIRATLESTLRELLPLDAQRLAEGRIYIAFAARAAVSPALSEIQADTLARITATLEATLNDAVDAGEVAADLHPVTEARSVLALADGLTLQAISAPGSLRPPDLIRALDVYLDRLFTYH